MFEGGDLFKEYLAYIGSARSEGTLQAYASDIKSFIRFTDIYGKIRKREVGPRFLDAYLQWLKGQGFKAATVERRLQVLKSFFTWAIKRQYLRDNPFTWWEIPRATERLPRALTPEEEHRFFSRLRTRTRLDRVAMLGFRLARFSGLRRGECNALRWEDVDLVKANLIVRHGKGDQDRSVPIPGVGLLALLQVWHKENNHPESGLVLSGLYKQELGRFLSVRFRQAAGTAGIVDASFHTLRATFATRLMEAGVHPRTIQVLLGHKSLETTQKYLAVADLQKREAVDKIDANY